MKSPHGTSETTDHSTANLVPIRAALPFFFEFIEEGETVGKEEVLGEIGFEIRITVLRADSFPRCISPPYPSDSSHSDFLALSLSFHNICQNFIRSP